MSAALSPKQQAAVDYLAAHPDATVAQVLAVADVAGGDDNRAAFILRLLNRGALRLTVPA